jgi:hypothetical protein
MARLAQYGSSLRLSARLGAGDDQTIEARAQQRGKVVVARSEFGANVVGPRQVGDGEKRHPNRGLARSGADEGEELPLGRLPRRIGHVVDEADSDAVAAVARGDGDGLPGVEEKRHSANPSLLGRDERRRATRVARGQRLIEIGENVVDVLDADREADHLRPHAGFLLLRGRHLTVRGRCRVAGERLGVAHVDQPLEQLQRVVELLAGLEPASDAEGDERAGAAAEIFLRQRVIGAVREAGIIDPRDPPVPTQEFAFQGKRPLSTIAPPSVVPWPPRNLVSE